jgi:hypothetical protein
MKTIQPINIYYNGQNVFGSIFQLYCISDNLINTAEFYYSIRMSDNQPNGTNISSGNIVMNGDDYTNNWNTNDDAYYWAASKLSLTITGDYIPPVTR